MTATAEKPKTTGNGAAPAAPRKKVTAPLFDPASIAAPADATDAVKSTRNSMLDKVPVARDWIAASWNSRKAQTFKARKAKNGKTIPAREIEYGADKEIGPFPSEAAAEQAKTLLRLAANELPKTDISKSGVGVRAVVVKRETNGKTGWVVLYRAKTRVMHEDK